MVIDDRIIDRHCTDHSRAFLCEPPAEPSGIAKRAQIHDGLCPHFYRTVHLFKLCVEIWAVPGHAQIDVNLCPQHRTDAIWLNTGMYPVAGNHYLPFCCQIADLLCFSVLLFRYNLHLPGNDPLSGRVHLCRVIHFGLLLILIVKFKRQQSVGAYPSHSLSVSVPEISDIFHIS